MIARKWMSNSSQSSVYTEENETGGGGRPKGRLISKDLRLNLKVMLDKDLTFLHFLVNLWYIDFWVENYPNFDPCDMIRTCLVGNGAA